MVGVRRFDREIAASGVDFERTISGVSRRDSNVVKLAIFGSGKAECVLAADLSGDIHTDLGNICNLPGEICLTPGLPGNLRQRLRILVSVVLVEDADRIDDDAGFLRVTQNVHH